MSGDVLTTFSQAWFYMLMTIQGCCHKVYLYVFKKEIGLMA